MSHLWTELLDLALEPDQPRYLGEQTRLGYGFGRYVSARRNRTLASGQEGNPREADQPQRSPASSRRRDARLRHTAIKAEVADMELADAVFSSLTEVSGDARVEELARMIDGAKTCKATLDAARTMLVRRRQ